MKIRSDHKAGNVVLETRRDEALPPVALPEIQLRTLLVPVDFSESSRKAVRYAVSLAKQFGAEIILLHVVEVPSPHVGMVDTSQVNVVLRKSSGEHLSAWKNELLPASNPKTLIREGSAANEIVRAAEETNADLILVGTHGRTGLARALLGSTAEKILRHAPCPVMVVREREHDFITTDTQRV